MKETTNMQSTNNNQKVRLSIEEFLSMNDEWLEKEALAKKKSFRRVVIVTILMIFDMILPFVILWAAANIFYLGYSVKIIIGFFVTMAGFIAIMVWAVSAENKGKRKSDKIKKELYQQYLKDNGFI